MRKLESMDAIIRSLPTQPNKLIFKENTKIDGNFVMSKYFQRQKNTTKVRIRDTLVENITACNL